MRQRRECAPAPSPPGPGEGGRLDGGEGLDSELAVKFANAISGNSKKPYTRSELWTLLSLCGVPPPYLDLTIDSLPLIWRRMEAAQKKQADARRVVEEFVEDNYPPVGLHWFGRGKFSLPKPKISYYTALSVPRTVTQGVGGSMLKQAWLARK